MTARCVATNPAGARCMFRGDHGNDGHLFADDRDAGSFRYGSLAMAVDGFLAGRLDRAYLAAAFAETEAMKS